MYELFLNTVQLNNKSSNISGAVYDNDTNIMIYMACIHNPHK